MANTLSGGICPLTFSMEIYVVLKFWVVTLSSLIAVYIPGLLSRPAGLLM